MLFVFTLSSSSFDKISINKILSFLFCGNLILHIFYLLSKLIFFGEISSYSYYSHASLILLSGTGAYVVFMNKFSFKQILLFFGSIFCILATSHGSLLLAFFFSFVCAIIFKNNLKPFFGFYVLPFVFLPFFLFDSNLEYIITNIDENLFFRRVYWQQALESLASYKLLFFGHGLGVEYVDADFVQDLIYYFGHDNQLGNLHKRYTLSLHNSFLSFFYHYGLIVFLVIVNYFFFITFRFRNICYSKEKIGMALSVLGGFTVWCSFNVILELPYSSSFFWILFFYCCRALTYSSNSWFLPS
jgi:hypothetical protein